MNISIDLEDYEEEVKETFCNERDCLNKQCFNVSFKKKFLEYINDLEKNFLFYNEKEDYGVLLSNLKYFGSFL